MVVQIEVLYYRHIVDHHMVDDVSIGIVAGPHDLLGGQAAAYLVSSLNYRYLESGLGQVCRCHQTVGAGAYNNGIPGAFTGKLIEYPANQ